MDPAKNNPHLEAQWESLAHQVRGLAKQLHQPQRWPAGSPFTFLPMPVALECCGWFELFEKGMLVPRLQAVASTLAQNHELSPMVHVAGGLLDKLRENPQFRATSQALLGSDAHTTSLFAMYATELAFRRRHGTIIETTPALDEQMLGSDIADNLPTSMLVAPFPATYLHFGMPLPLPAPPSFVRHLVGAYVFMRDGPVKFRRQLRPGNGRSV